MAFALNLRPTNKKITVQARKPTKAQLLYGHAKVHSEVQRKVVDSHRNSGLKVFHTSFKIDERFSTPAKVANPSPTNKCSTNPPEPSRASVEQMHTRRDEMARISLKSSRIDRPSAPVQKDKIGAGSRSKDAASDRKANGNSHMPNDVPNLFGSRDYTESKPGEVRPGSAVSSAHLSEATKDLQRKCNDFLESGEGPTELPVPFNGHNPPNQMSSSAGSGPSWGLPPQISSKPRIDLSGHPPLPQNSHGADRNTQRSPLPRTLQNLDSFPKGAIRASSSKKRTTLAHADRNSAPVRWKAPHHIPTEAPEAIPAKRARNKLKRRPTSYVTPRPSSVPGSTGFFSADVFGSTAGLFEFPALDSRNDSDTDDGSVAGSATSRDNEPAAEPASGQENGWCCCGLGRIIDKEWWSRKGCSLVKCMKSLGYICCCGKSDLDNSDSGDGEGEGDDGNKDDNQSGGNGQENGDRQHGSSDQSAVDGENWPQGPDVRSSPQAIDQPGRLGEIRLFQAKSSPEAQRQEYMRENDIPPGTMSQASFERLRPYLEVLNRDREARLQAEYGQNSQSVQGTTSSVQAQAQDSPHNSQSTVSVPVALSVPQSNGAGAATSSSIPPALADILNPPGGIEPFSDFVLREHPEFGPDRPVPASGRQRNDEVLGGASNLTEALMHVEDTELVGIVEESVPSRKVAEAVNVNKERRLSSRALIKHSTDSEDTGDPAATPRIPTLPGRRRPSSMPASVRPLTRTSNKYAHAKFSTPATRLRSSRIQFRSAASYGRPRTPFPFTSNGQASSSQAGPGNRTEAPNHGTLRRSDGRLPQRTTRPRPSPPTNPPNNTSRPNHQVNGSNNNLAPSRQINGSNNNPNPSRQISGSNNNPTSGRQINGSNNQGSRHPTTPPNNNRNSRSSHAPPRPQFSRGFFVEHLEENRDFTELIRGGRTGFSGRLVLGVRRFTLRMLLGRELVEAVVGGNREGNGNGNGNGKEKGKGEGKRKREDGS
ncbi:hypothetical protein CC80DRAFT_555079 [Byssothecium circinans]|uniref:Uncharacterized protein n=1 Tax=Byssothecium circinans TaxID=147558 RepID=A0A6A5TBY8_9PLEO|nr:hypothetical protein CC80DRAFT_555079 [Byssothecium circinans]